MARLDDAENMNTTFKYLANLLSILQLILSENDQEKILGAENATYLIMNQQDAATNSRLEAQGAEELVDQLKELFFKVGLRENVEEEMTLREAGFMIAEFRGLIMPHVLSNANII